MLTSFIPSIAYTCWKTQNYNCITEFLDYEGLFHVLSKGGKKRKRKKNVFIFMNLYAHQHCKWLQI